jgi:hypothetical protein
MISKIDKDITGKSYILSVPFLNFFGSTEVRA